MLWQGESGPVEDAAPAASSSPPVARPIIEATGVPFNNTHFLTALEQAGHRYHPAGTADCSGSRVPGVIYEDDQGTALALWTYPSQQALLEDWDAVRGQAPAPRNPACYGDSPNRMWHANLVVIFTRGDLIRRQAAAGVFLGLAEP